MVPRTEVWRDGAYSGGWLVGSGAEDGTPGEREQAAQQLDKGHPVCLRRMRLCGTRTHPPQQGALGIPRAAGRGQDYDAATPSGFGYCKGLLDG